MFSERRIIVAETCPIEQSTHHLLAAEVAIQEFLIVYADGHQVGILHSS